jgi:Lrp/AsnC family leucine-responsive transcriptional regulator
VEDLDRSIVGLLLNDGRMSYTDLGRATGLSTSAVDHDAVGLPLTAFISVSPLDPSAPDDVPERLRDILDIEACHSVAGDESYILKVRVATPGALEDLLARIRSAAGVSTRTTVVLSTPWEGRAGLPG